MKRLRSLLRKSSRSKAGEGSSRAVELDLNLEAPIDDAQEEMVEDFSEEEGSKEGEEQVAMEHVATEACYVPVIAATDMPGPSSFQILPSYGFGNLTSDRKCSRRVQKWRCRGTSGRCKTWECYSPDYRSNLSTWSSSTDSADAETSSTSKQH